VYYTPDWDNCRAILGKNSINSLLSEGLFSRIELKKYVSRMFSQGFN